MIECLERIGRLQGVWLAGGGTTPSKNGLTWLDAILKNNFEENAPFSRLHPTEEGEIVAEWAIGDFSISLRIDLDNKQAFFYSENKRTDESISED